MLICCTYPEYLSTKLRLLETQNSQDPWEGPDPYLALVIWLEPEFTWRTNIVQPMFQKRRHHNQQHHQQQVLARMRGKRNPLTLLVGM
jgi:hypothetical protein